MISVEVLEFLEDNAISIEKFLQENFSIESYIPKFNAKKKKWRIKHNEIAGWYNVIPVSMKFAYRYKHLVLTGKLIVVHDDFGKYCVYVNPRVISESCELAELQAILHDLEENMEPDTLRMVEIKRQLAEKIQDIEENIRIIKHFKGEESLEYNMGIMHLIDESKNLSRVRRRVEKDEDLC